MMEAEEIHGTGVHFQPDEKIVYFAHPFGGKRGNVDMAGYLAEKLFFAFPRITLFSPIHNWGYLSYEGTDQYEIINDCLSLLSRCDALVLSGNWLHSCGCCAEYAAAREQGKQIYEWDGSRLSILNA